MQGVALLDKEETEQLVDGVILLHPRNFCPFPFGKGKIGIEGAGDEVGLQLARIGRKHAQMRRKIVVDFHKAHGDKAVEPGVGDLFHDGPICRLIVAFLLLLADGVR